MFVDDVSFKYVCCLFCLLLLLSVSRSLSICAFQAHGIFIRTFERSNLFKFTKTNITQFFIFSFCLLIAFAFAFAFDFAFVAVSSLYKPHKTQATAQLNVSTRSEFHKKAWHMPKHELEPTKRARLWQSDSLLKSATKNERKRERERVATVRPIAKKHVEWTRFHVHNELRGGQVGVMASPALGVGSVKQ